LKTAQLHSKINHLFKQPLKFIEENMEVLFYILMFMLSALFVGTSLGLAPDL